jgi:hypothetical protein
MSGVQRRSPTFAAHLDSLTWLEPEEDAMSGTLVADLGLDPRVWLFLALLLCLTLFFKFNRFWSVRNLDLLLLFALAPGLMMLVGRGGPPPWTAYLGLFIGSGLLLVRCLIDLGLTRRPLLEPNLNSAGLACLAAGVLGLLLAETVSLPVDEGAARNPADPHANAGERITPGGESDPHVRVARTIRESPLPVALKRPLSRIIVSRVLAFLAHLGLVGGLAVVGWKHFERPIAGWAMATCYLVLPYTRIAVVDCGQLLPAALIVWAVVLYKRPLAAGALIGLSAGWMPACLGLVPLWAGFYGRRGALSFLSSALGIVACAGLAGWLAPSLADACRDLGARGLSQAGLVLTIEAPHGGSFWAQIDANYRLPVLILYLAFVVLTTFWPAEKNLGELIALSAALLVASQFWYLDQGGTLILLYLPLVLLMMFRPNLAAKRPQARAPLARSERRVSVAGI